MFLGSLIKNKLLRRFTSEVSPNCSIYRFEASCRFPSSEGSLHSWYNILARSKPVGRLVPHEFVAPIEKPEPTNNKLFPKFIFLVFTTDY